MVGTSTARNASQGTSTARGSKGSAVRMEGMDENCITFEGDRIGKEFNRDGPRWNEGCKVAESEENVSAKW